MARIENALVVAAGQEHKLTMDIHKVHRSQQGKIHQVDFSKRHSNVTAKRVAAFFLSLALLSTLFLPLLDPKLFLQFKSFWSGKRVEVLKVDSKLLKKAEILARFTTVVKARSQLKAARRLAPLVQARVRGLIARKRYKALRGMVRLQALARGRAARRPLPLPPLPPSPTPTPSPAPSARSATPPPPLVPRPRTPETPFDELTTPSTPMDGDFGGSTQPTQPKITLRTALFTAGLFYTILKGGSATWRSR
ncbi:MAG: hypothetical protein MRY21_02545 [Simkaniaceae bacterium]|nr:hypothetical protein [Simkaniaceae bacterium]